MAKFPSYSLLSPRKSFSRGDYLEQKTPDFSNKKPQQHLKKTPLSAADKSNDADHEDSTKESGDFEFNLVDNFTMLPADELFYDGKLMPLQVSMVKMTEASCEPPSRRVLSTQRAEPLSRNEISIMDPHLFSPKAPRCSTSWKEFLGLRKAYRENNLKSNSSTTTKSLKNLLHRSSRASMSLSFDGSLNLPLLKDSDNEFPSLSSSRLSLSSSSSSHEHDDVPRLSLDSSDHKFNSITLPRVAAPIQNRAPPVAKARKSTSSLQNPINRGRVTQSTTHRQPDPNLAAPTVHVAFMDSPRMNASGKIVYNALERSSSGPSSYGGPRYKHSSVQRSYSANVRITPVLNVPVCSLRGSSTSKSGGVFGLFASSTSTQQKRDTFGSINGAKSSNSSKGSHQSCKHRKDRKLTESK